MKKFLSFLLMCSMVSGIILPPLSAGADNIISVDNNIQEVVETNEILLEEIEIVYDESVSDETVSSGAESESSEEIETVSGEVEFESSEDVETEETVSDEAEYESSEETKTNDTVTNETEFVELEETEPNETECDDTEEISLSSNEYETLTYSVNEYDEVVITGCDAAAVSVTIPEEIDGMPVTVIGEYAFADCVGLREVFLNENIERIGSFAFLNCGLLSALYLGDNVIEIDETAFDGADAVEFYCNADSYAAEYAIGHEIPFSDSDSGVETENLTLNLENTVYCITKDKVSNSGYIPMTLNYEFKNDVNPENINIIVKLPENTRLLEKTIFIDGVLCENFSSEENILTIPTGKRSATIIFHLNPLNYGIIESEAKVTYTENGIEKEEVIGNVCEEKIFLTVISPETTDSDSFEVNGVTLPGKRVNLYVDGDRRGSVSSNSEGIYTAKLTLPKLVNRKIHFIAAEIENGEEKVISKTKIAYQKDNLIIKSFTIEHNGKTYDANSANIAFNPGSKFKFILKFDETGVMPEKLYVESEKNNVKKRMEAVWNKEQGAYIAEGFFDPSNTSYVPGKINILCKGAQKYFNLDAPIDITSSEFQANIPEKWKNAKVTIAKNSEKELDLTLDIPEDDGSVSSVNVVKEDIEAPKGITADNAEKNGYTLVYEDKRTNEKVFTKIYEKDRVVTETLRFVEGTCISAFTTGVGIAAGNVGIGGVINGSLDAKNLCNAFEDTVERDFEYEEMEYNVKNAPEIDEKVKEEVCERLRNIRTTNAVYGFFRCALGIATIGGSIILALSGAGIPVAITLGSASLDVMFSAVQVNGVFESTDMMVAIQSVALGYSDIDAIVIRDKYKEYSYGIMLDGTIVITGYSDKLVESLSIPSYIEDFPVTMIGEYAFANCTELSSITVPDTVTKIKSYAFKNCTRLSNIKLSANLECIESDAFYRFIPITELTIPATLINSGGSKVYQWFDCTLTVKDKLEKVIIEEGATAIPADYFEYTSIKTVIIPDSVTSIGSSAFSGCKNLSSINIPDSVTSIGGYVFENCTKLCNIDIPDGVTSIENGTFSGCKNLSSINIPDSVINIGYYAFEDCTSLSSVRLSSNLESLGKCAFDNCTSIRELNIPAPLINSDSLSVYEWFGRYYGEDKLEKVIIEEGATAIPADYFEYTSIKTVIIPDSVTSIGSSAFSGCKNLSSINIPDSVTSIGDYAFSGCTNLNNIVLPDSVTSIGDKAFRNCRSLIDIKLSHQLNDIGYGTFENCDALTEVTIPATVTVSSGHWFVECDNLKTVTFEKGTNVILKSALYGSTVECVIMPDTVTKIESGAFYNCTNLSDIRLSLSLKSVEESVFYNCVSIRELNIPAKLINAKGFGVREWFKAYNGFYSTNQLEKIVIEEGAKAIPKEYFRSISIKTVIIPDSVTSIGEWAFAYCRNLSNIEVSDNLRSIGMYAFEYCTNLSSIDIPDGVTSIEAYAFWDCTSLSNIKLSSNLKSIGDNVFYNCTAIRELNIPATLINTGTGRVNDWFNGTDKLEKVVIEEGATAIPGRYLMDTSVKTLIIPDTVTQIGGFAFSNCKNLSSIDIPDSVTSIIGSAFSGCVNLNNIKLSSNLTSVGDNAFYNCIAIGELTIPSMLINLGGRALRWFGGSCDKIELEKVVIEEGATVIPNSCFSGMSIKTVIIPDSVTSIGDYAFENCTNLSSINIPDSVITIGRCAFSGCTSLSNVKLPPNLESVGDYALCNCAALTELNIPATLINTDTGRVNNWFNGTDKLEKVVIEEGATAIRDSYFRGISVKTVIIPDSVTSIGGYAFRDCTSLSDIKLSSNLKSIGSNAFYNCTSLKELNIPASLMNAKKVNVKDWFSGTDNLEKVIAEAGITAIPANFLSGTSVKTVDIPQSVTSVGTSAFEGCTNLSEVILPDNLKYIGYQAFRNCDSLQEMTIPSTVISSQSETCGYWFRECSNLKKVTFSQGATVIPASALKNSTVENVVIPDGVTVIEDSAFMGCKNLVNIIVPDSVTKIENSAFENCTSLSSIKLSKNLERIGLAALKNCTAIAELNIPAKLINTAKENVSSWYDGTCNLEIIVIETGATAIPSNYFRGTPVKTVILPNTITKIGTIAFYNCVNLSSIIIPDCVTSIDSYAFGLCKNLRNVNLPSNLTSIGTNVFAGCVSLKELSISASLMNANKININEWFSGADKLEKVIVEEGITTIPAGFASGTSIKYIVIPEGVKTIGSAAFKGCTNLIEVIIPDSVTVIGGSAFSGCTSLSKVKLSENLERLAQYAFYNCDSLEEITIPSSVISSKSADGTYGNWFRGCDNFKKVIFEDGATIIPSYCLAYSKLETVVIPDSVTSIGSYAFSECTNLTDIAIPVGVTTVGNSAFSGCTGLKDVYYYGTNEQWNGMVVRGGNGAFTGAQIHYIVSVDADFTVKQSASDKLTASVEAENIPDSAVIYIVSYDDGILIEAAVLNNNMMTTQLSSENVDCVKMFIWDKNMIPLCNSKQVLKQEFLTA